MLFTQSVGVFELLFTGFLALSVSAGLYAWRHAVKTLLKARRPTPIAKAQSGRVKLVGRVRFKSAGLSAPLSGRRCAAYHVTVEEMTSDNPELIRETHADDFYIEDETGRALVRVAHRRLELMRDRRYQSFPNELKSEGMVQLLVRHDAIIDFGNLWLAYDEGVLEENEPVAVIGFCRRESDPDPRAQHSYREHAQIVVVEGTNDDPLLISDDPETMA